MSTKIYTGFRINTGNFLEVHKIVQGFRSEVTPIMEQKFYEQVCIQMVFYVDGDYFSQREKVVENPLMVAIEDCQRLHENVHRTGVNTPFLDYEFSIVLIPYGNITLGIYYADKGHGKIASELWMEQSGVEEYCYFNNTDTPEGISQEEWDRRGEVWEEALGHDTPSKRGYSWEIFGPRGLPYPTWEDIRNHLGKVTDEMRNRHLEYCAKDGVLDLPEDYTLPEITFEKVCGK